MRLKQKGMQGTEKALTTGCVGAFANLFANVPGVENNFQPCHLSETGIIKIQVAH